MYILGLSVWAGISFLIARAISRLLTLKARRTWIRPVLTTALLPVVVISPLTDEILAKRKYERLCEEAKEVTIHGTHPVGEELYTADGKWRRGALAEMRARGEISSDDEREESNRLQERYESLLKWDLGGKPEVIAAPIPIYRWRKKIVDRTDGRVLIDWTDVATPGGWVGRGLGGPMLVPHRCHPSLIRDGRVDQVVLPFKKKSEIDQ